MRPILFFFTYFFLSGTSFSSVIVNKILVQGNNRVEITSIKELSGLEEGIVYSNNEINTSLKKMFRTKYFSDIHLEENRGFLTIKVIENPVISNISFRGNSTLKRSTLEFGLILKKYYLYDISMLRHDLRYIYNIYCLQGYISASVIPKITYKAYNIVDITYQILEGTAVKVKSINFIGNKTYSGSTLKIHIESKEPSWHRFFYNYAFDYNRIEYDKYLLNKFYLDNGYLDFKIKYSVVEFDINNNHFLLTFKLHEGKRYYVGDIDIESDIQGINKKDILPLLDISAGECYSSKNINNSLDYINSYLFDKGSLFYDVSFNTIKNDNTISLIININSCNKLYVDKILISGNFNTDEDIIRREFILSEGDAFDIIKLKNSERNIKKLGLFKKVLISKQASHYSDKVILLVDVEEEDSTGELSIAAGIGSLDGILLEFSMLERNLCGRGQEIEAKLKLSNKIQDFNFSFIENYFFNQKLKIGLNIYFTQHVRELDKSSLERIIGVRSFMSYEIYENLFHTLSYHLHHEKVSLLDRKYSDFFDNHKGAAIKSMVSQKITWDKLDNHFIPTKGLFLELDSVFVGLGGTERYISNVLKISYFNTFSKKITLNIKCSYGLLLDIDKDVRVSDMYVLGGALLRGFDFNGIGPRDSITDNSLHGNKYYNMTTELFLPTFIPSNFNMRCSIFFDLGILWGINNFGHATTEDNIVRSSLGFGVDWGSPFGPMRFDVSFPFIRSFYDKRTCFVFGASTLF